MICSGLVEKCHVFGERQLTIIDSLWERTEQKLVSSMRKIENITSDIFEVRNIRFKITRNVSKIIVCIDIGDCCGPCPGSCTWPC